MRFRLGYLLALLVLIPALAGASAHADDPCQNTSDNPQTPQALEPADHAISATARPVFTWRLEPCTSAKAFEVTNGGYLSGVGVIKDYTDQQDLDPGATSVSPARALPAPGIYNWAVQAWPNYDCSLCDPAIFRSATRTLRVLDPLTGANVKKYLRAALDYAHAYDLGGAVVRGRCKPTAAHSFKCALKGRYKVNLGGGYYVTYKGWTTLANRTASDPDVAYRYDISVTEQDVQDSDRRRGHFRDHGRADQAVLIYSTGEGG